MWNRHQSSFAILKVRHRSFKFILPVPLFIFDDLLKGALDLALLGEWFFPRQKLPSTVISMALHLVYELRRLGRWQMADIAFDEHQISLSFY